MHRLFASSRYPFTREGLDIAPRSPGIYGLFYEGQVIYVGSTATDPARTIHASLSAHLHGAHGDCTASAMRYSWAITLSSAVEAAQILEEYETEHGCLPHCHAE